MKILLIAGHGNLGASVANKAIIERLAQEFPDMAIRKLSEIAPDGNFDVAAEQAALAAADLIIWQFPFNWYAMPWLMKKWLDEVFVFGFAYGTGAKLGGKKLLVSVTTGAPESAYTGDANAAGDIRAFISLHQGTAKTCGLDWQGALWVNGIGFAAPGDEAAIARQREKALAHAERLIARISEIKAV